MTNDAESILEQFRRETKDYTYDMMENRYRADLTKNSKEEHKLCELINNALCQPQKFECGCRVGGNDVIGYMIIQCNWHKEVK